jgi:hypothetical protein
MKINEILVESTQLDEGPFSDVAKKVGTKVGKAVGGVAKGVGKAIGGVAKGVGAVAGVAQGAKQAYQQGKQASIDVIGGTGQGADTPAEQPAASAAPTTQQINKAGPVGSAPAKTVTGVAKQALQKTAQAMGKQTPDQAGQTLYAQVKSQINQLDKKGKQRILQLLQKSVSQPASAQNPVAGAANKVAGAAGNAVKKAVGTKPNQTQQNLAKTGNPVGAVTK